MSLLSPRLAAVVAIATLGAVPAVASPPQDPASSAPACVALVLPSVTGAESAANVSAAVRDLFASYLNGPSIKTQLLEARLPSQAVLEAQQKQCGHLLLVSVTRKHSGGGGSKVGGILGQAAEGAAWHVPYTAGVGGAVAAGAAIGSVQAISGFASETRKKDEIELAYRIGSPESVEAATPVVSKAKAKSDGEDLLTPLVEHASEAIVHVATGK